MKHLSKYSIYFILLLGFVLRIVNINQSLWLDEAISALAAKNFSFYGIIFEFLKGDNHPPLYYLILRFWGIIFGFSDVVLRMLSVLVGTATIFLTYLFLKKLFDKNVAILGSFLLAISPLHIYYSQEIRMYPLLGLLAVGLVYLFTFFKNKSVSKWLWMLFATGLVILVAIDYTGVFLLPVFWVIGWKEKISFKKIFTGFIPLGLVFFSWLPILWQQKETAIIQLSSLPGWRNLAGGTPKEVIVLWMKLVLGRISFYPKLVYYFTVGIFSVPILLSLYQSVFKKSFWLWVFFLLPLVSSLALSFIVPSFNYFRFIYILPAFYGLIALGLINIKKRLSYLVLGLIVIGNLTGLSFYYFNESNQREQWRQAVLYIENENPNMVVFEFPQPFAPYYWYSSDKVKAIGGLTDLNSKYDLTSEKLNQEFTSEVKNIIYVSYLRDLTDSQDDIQRIIKLANFKQVKAVSFSGVGEVISYER